MPDLALEHRLHRQGFRLVAGVDEAGRGPLAGPVAAGAVILDPDLSESEPWLALVDDSKRLSPAQREKALVYIQQRALAVGVALVDAGEIDRLGIGPANVEAMRRAVANLPVQPDHLLLDFVQLRKIPPNPSFDSAQDRLLKRGDGGGYPFDLVIRGDSRSYSIAAASIVAKVTRDRLMQEADAIYPGYHFARNKGYPTAQHLARLRALGPCPIHRRSFAPVRKSLQPPFTKGGIEGLVKMPSPRSRLGRLGEELASQFLREKGYAILATNYRCLWGEVDIVACDGEDLVFVEVRTRRSTGYGAPEESLTPAKVRRLLATAQDYLQKHADSEASWRIDLVCIRPDRRRSSPRIDHLRHAVQG